MKSLWLSLGLLSFISLAACTPPAEPTPAQITIVQPGIEAEQRGNYGFALFTYRYWARLNVALAQYRLARLYEHGLGTEQDDPEAAKWYRAASETGYQPAHAALARLYEQGRGVPQDDAAAFALYQKAAAAGDSEAHYKVGRFLELGRGTAVDPRGAVAHYQIAAKAGNVDAQLALAELSSTGRRTPEHTGLHSAGHQVALHGGDPRARQGLAHMPAKTTLEARREIELAGVRTEIQDRLGRSSSAAEVGAEPSSSALEHEAFARDAASVAQYRQAARHGDGLAAFKIAEAFERGKGVAPDLVEALTWYGIAQRQGYTGAASHVETLRGALPSAEVQEASGRMKQWWQKFALTAAKDTSGCFVFPVRQDHGIDHAAMAGANTC